MIKYEDECVNCPPEMGCLGSGCRYKNVPHYYCDNCGTEIWYDDILYDEYGEILCDLCYHLDDEDNIENNEDCPIAHHIGETLGMVL